MRRISFDRGRKKSRAPNITPLIDIIFLLIVFYLLSSSFVDVQAITLNVESTTASAQPVEEKESVLIALYGNDTFRFNGKALNISRLQEELKRHFSDFPSRNVVIWVAPELSVGQLVHGMDQIKQLGATNISLMHDA
jgi:biopolymer transport protein ExbD